ncbi:MAG TPA: thioesterase family protein [Candidatus Polarisedimenticolia bacterium]|nr:thioesterase family protein [Candidatus Polarisedimenticolia bacterium]
MARSSKVIVRVRYPEVDRMGVVHHRNHFVWFEIGRTELMREAGLPYAGVEDGGLYLPVIEASCSYHSPARYDEELQVTTTLEKVSPVRATFGYRLERKADGRLLASGTTTHAAIDGRGRPRRLPDALRRLLV